MKFYPIGGGILFACSIASAFGVLPSEDWTGVFAAIWIVLTGFFLVMIYRFGEHFFDWTMAKIPERVLKLAAKIDAIATRNVRAPEGIDILISSREIKIRFQNRSGQARSASRQDRTELVHIYVDSNRDTVGRR